MKERDLYSIDEARERLGGISRNLIYEILRSGRLKRRSRLTSLHPCRSHRSAHCPIRNNHKPHRSGCTLLHPNQAADRYLAASVFPGAIASAIGVCAVPSSVC